MAENNQHEQNVSDMVYLSTLKIYMKNKYKHYKVRNETECECLPFISKLVHKMVPNHLTQNNAKIHFFQQ